MPRVTILGIEGTQLERHALLLTEELERLSYCVHYVTDKTPINHITGYLKEGDVVVDYNEVSPFDIAAMKANIYPLKEEEKLRIVNKTDVFIWVDVPVDKLDTVKQSYYEPSSYTATRTIALKYAKDNNWKVATFSKFPLLQSRIEQLVLTNLIYEKSGTFVFGQLETTTSNENSTITIQEEVLTVIDETPKQQTKKPKHSKKRKRRSKPKR